MPQKANRHGFTVVRVKGWGKSPPRDWQQERHGKPHREQDRIGTVRGETLEGCFRLTVRVGCVRCMATCAQDEWPPRSRAARGEGHTEPGLQASWQFLPDTTRTSPDISRLRHRAPAGSGALTTEPALLGSGRNKRFLKSVRLIVPYRRGQYQQRIMGQVDKRSITLSPELAAAVDVVVAAGEYARRAR